ncbi:phosphoenolpyruvate carboxykinase [Parvularcula marina]|uniref:Phosphoenolpyruvate carboxykinase (ATP) n=1 Tax=Parvularcula marina TaxID=2292771 RepID=A0A371RLG2_9PROT|nr:phosphoenolpyruvate carboxykinase [Parvularcula marina]RFB06305.1 phosphoenolpyruvate carboxykinase [Parvularcula marina]
MTSEHMLAPFGVKTAGLLHHNLKEAALYQQAIERGEGEIAEGGPLVVKTGLHTGRSAKDKFTVRDDTSEDTLWWDNNAEMSPGNFEALWSDFREHLEGRELFVQDLFGGADPQNRIAVRVINELAWHNLFIRHLLRRPSDEELERFDPEYTIINLPSFKADPARHGVRSDTVIAVNFTKKLILIGGTAYAGETKKSVFTLLNYVLPERGIMPMHCSVNVGSDGDAAVFFGLSGTGKTTLSADPNRQLVGDDEHGWTKDGLFNFEGGCYAKMIRLSAKAEPEIHATTKKWGTVLENVVMDPETRELDLDDDTLAENSRGAYPIHYIPNIVEDGQCGPARNVVMLTCDAFGVMPPIAKLSTPQAMYHFLSGYTAKVAGTERGVTEPTATFSTCFGAPFMPRHPSVYGELLRRRLEETGATCWLVNTGWTGGAYGAGERMPIAATRALLNAALDGSLNTERYREDENFGFLVPMEAPGIETDILNPRSTWADPAAYDQQARKLAEMFRRNFEKFEAHVAEDVRKAAPGS